MYQFIIYSQYKNEGYYLGMPLMSEKYLHKAYYNKGFLFTVLCITSHTEYQALLYSIIHTK